MPRGKRDVKSYSMPQVSRMVGMSDSWAYTERRAGRLHTFHDENGEERVSADEVLRFLETKIGHKAAKAEKLVEAEITVEYDLVTQQTLARLLGSSNGHLAASGQSPEEMHAKLQRGQERKWADEVDPTKELRSKNPKEFRRRMEQRRQSHMKRMTYESVKSGAQRKAWEKAQREKQAEEAESETDDN